MRCSVLFAFWPWFFCGCTIRTTSANNKIKSWYKQTKTMFWLRKTLIGARSPCQALDRRTTDEKQRPPLSPPVTRIQSDESSRPRLWLFAWFTCCFLADAFVVVAALWNANGECKSYKSHADWGFVLAKWVKDVGRQLINASGRQNFCDPDRDIHHQHRNMAWYMAIAFKLGADHFVSFSNLFLPSKNCSPQTLIGCRLFCMRCA